MHSTFMRASKAYNAALEQSSTDKARRALVRLMGVCIRQRKGEPAKGAHMHQLLRSARGFNHANMLTARAALIKAGHIQEIPCSK